MNIVVANFKGGVGKTTTSVYLAAIAGSLGHDQVTLVDADRQASTAEWAEMRPLDGVEIVEAPSTRTLTKAMNSDADIVVVDTPPNDEQIMRTALNLADKVVVPTRAGGVEFGPAQQTVDQIPAGVACGVVICAARLGTKDLEDALEWWPTEGKTPVWGIIPERVAIATGPEAKLSYEGRAAYANVLAAVIKAKSRKK